MAVATKGEKKRWHREMKPIACEAANSTCQMCRTAASEDTGAMYFKEWTAGMYSSSVLDLMEQGICLWTCDDCYRANAFIKTPKAEKFAWHKKFKPAAARYAKEICHHCKHHTPEDEGVIHHESYSPGVYKQHVIHLMKNGICVWLCKDCHQEEHRADCVEDGIKTQQTGGECYFCGRYNYNGWKRARQRGDDKNICRRCWRSGKKERKREESGQLSLLDMLS